MAASAVPEQPAATQAEIVAQRFAGNPDVAQPEAVAPQPPVAPPDVPVQTTPAVPVPSEPVPETPAPSPETQVAAPQEPVTEPTTLEAETPPPAEVTETLGEETPPVQAAPEIEGQATPAEEPDMVGAIDDAFAEVLESEFGVSRSQTPQEAVPFRPDEDLARIESGVDPTQKITITESVPDGHGGFKAAENTYTLADLVKDKARGTMTIARMQASGVTNPDANQPLGLGPAAEVPISGHEAVADVKRQPLENLVEADVRDRVQAHIYNDPQYQQQAREAIRRKNLPTLASLSEEDAESWLNAELADTMPDFVAATMAKSQGQQMVRQGVVEQATAYRNLFNQQAREAEQWFSGRGTNGRAVVDPVREIVERCIDHGEPPRTEQERRVVACWDNRIAMASFVYYHTNPEDQRKRGAQDAAKVLAESAKKVLSGARHARKAEVLTAVKAARPPGAVAAAQASRTSVPTPPATNLAHPPDMDVDTGPPTNVDIHEKAMRMAAGKA